MEGRMEKLSRRWLDRTSLSNGYLAEDDGRGIVARPEEIAQFFSIGRGQEWRRPRIKTLGQAKLGRRR